jgi:ribonuclease-3
MRRLVRGIFRKIFKGGSSNINHGDKSLELLSQRLGYTFRDPSLLVDALKHRSFLAETGEHRLKSNERLELLGDSVLGMLVTEHLFRVFPEEEEGSLTAMKSLMVSRRALLSIGQEINLGQFIMLNQAEERAGGRKRPSIISDAFEAVIGAIYLDGGLEAARLTVEKLVISQLDRILTEEQHRNYKSMLLEYCQGCGITGPVYHVTHEEGPDHDKEFTVAARVNDETLGIGKGHSKKKAEQWAAKEALIRLQVL